MNDQASPPDGEKPRYLLPDGCRDLIDVLRPQQAATGPKLMYVYDSEGNSLGPPREIKPLEPIPNGLAALPRYVARLLHGPRAKNALTIGSESWRPAVSLLWAEGGMLLLLYYGDPGFAPERETRIRAFATRHALPPDARFHTNDPAYPGLAYFLPSAPKAVTSLFHEFLAECLGIQPYDTLYFDLFAVES